MKPVKQLLLAIALTGLCIAADLEKQVDEYAGVFVKMGRFSGSILVARDGQVLAAKGYGKANLEHGVPNTPRTKFRLGSITKQFTATAILQLEQRGKLSLEDPVKKHLSGAPSTWDRVTVHHLLTHTSGIPSYTDLPGYMKTMFMPVTVDEMIAKFRDLPLEFQPGEKFKYDDSGYFLLGAIIERVAGERYEDYVRKSIFEPLGMRDTGYDHFETILPNRASGYIQAKGKVEHAAYLDMSQPYSAGSLYSTVEDLLIWDQALYTEKLLPKTVLERMFKPFKDNYAYGWTVDRAFNRKRIAHGGGINGFNTMISRFPDDRVLVVVLSNTETGDTGRMAQDLSAMVFGEKYEAPK
jgi:CubicO group peptidase (beta-lactamase class C family)